MSFRVGAISVGGHMAHGIFLWGLVHVVGSTVEGGGCPDPLAGCGGLLIRLHFVAAHSAPYMFPANGLYVVLAPSRALRSDAFFSQRCRSGLPHTS